MPHISINSQIGPLSVFEESGALVALDWGRAPGPEETPLLSEAKRQLDAYFDRRLERFDLPLMPAGTDFQCAVWNAMLEIPFGNTLTYGDIARKLDSGPRAVGGASGRNPLPVIVPCHRVVGHDGALTGYSGAGGIDTKRALLTLEGCRLV